jgi:hypothetical protein
MAGRWVNDVQIERISIHSGDFKWLSAKMNNSIHTGASVTSYDIVAVKYSFFKFNPLI